MEIERDCCIQLAIGGDSIGEDTTEELLCRSLARVLWSKSCLDASWSCFADEIELLKCLLPPFEVPPPALLKQLQCVLNYFKLHKRILQPSFDEILGFTQHLNAAVDTSHGKI